jgi:formamidopyrimidine-DNA glycosylase
MPELPEVETTRRGIAPHLLGRVIAGVVLRAARLRLPLAPILGEELTGRRIVAVERRGKYLLIRCDGGTLIVHLGMSGHLRLVAAGTPAGKYDHVELVLDNGRLLRLSDPRKFGTVLWVSGDPFRHPLLANLGPEPLTGEFSATYLHECSRGRKVAVKPFLMDNRIVVGVGNIYANEALFRAGIDPATPAGKLTRQQCARLTAAVHEVLTEAIALGGTTLRDYLDSEGKPGYFRLNLRVYGRSGELCGQCASAIQLSRLGGRSTYWCPVCQR